MSDVVSMPAPGLLTINKVRGKSRNIDLTSSDGSVIITPNSGLHTVDLTINPEAIGIITDIPCDPTVYVGAWVYVDATGKAYNAIATAKITSNVVGIVESRDGDTVNVRYLGVSSVVFAGLDPTIDYMLSDSVAGGMMTLAPVGAGKVVLHLGQPISATQFLVNKKVRMVRS